MWISYLINMLRLPLNNLNKILLGILGLIIISISIYEYGYHKGYDQSQLENKNYNNAITIANQQLAYQKIIVNNQIRDNAVALLNNNLQIQNESYLTIIRELKNDQSSLVGKLNATNRINGLLVHTIQSGISGKPMPTIAESSNRVNGVSTYYRASDVAAGIIQVGHTCNKIRATLIGLQEYTRQQIINYNR